MIARLDETEDLIEVKMYELFIQTGWSGTSRYYASMNEAERAGRERMKATGAHFSVTPVWLAFEIGDAQYVNNADTGDPINR